LAWRVWSACSARLEPHEAASFSSASSTAQRFHVHGDCLRNEAVVGTPLRGRLDRTAGLLLGERVDVLVSAGKSSPSKPKTSPNWAAFSAAAAARYSA
jgi:hypothetical protein